MPGTSVGQDATIIGRPQSNNDDECVELSSLATSHSHSTIPNAPPTNVPPTCSQPTAKASASASAPSPPARVQQHTYLQRGLPILRTCYRAVCELRIKKKDLICWIAAALALVFGFIGVFALRPTIDAARDGHNAVLLAEWDARKSYIEYCESVSYSTLKY